MTKCDPSEIVEITALEANGCVNKAIREAGTATNFARKVGISPQALSNQANSISRKGYTPEVLHAAGVKVETRRVYKCRFDALPASVQERIIKSRGAGDAE